MGTNFFVLVNYCPHCKRGDGIHIGKQSAGWKFCFEATEATVNKKDFSLRSAKEWFDFIKENDLKINDEYGEQYTFEDFLKRVSFKTGMSSTNYNGRMYSGDRDMWDAGSKGYYLDPEGYDMCSCSFS